MTEELRVSNSNTSCEIDYSETTSDTSVLFNYTLRQDNGESKEILSDPSRKNVVSKNVRDEYENAASNRRDALKSMSKAAGRGSLDGWEVPDSLDLSVQDEDWCLSLKSRLCDIGSDKQILTKLSQAVRMFNKGYQDLFEGPDRWISEVTPRSNNALLRGYLQRVVDDKGDVKIICDAGAWSKDGGSGTFLTADKNHMLSNRDKIMDLVDRNREAGSICMLHPNEFLKQQS